MTRTTALSLLLLTGCGAATPPPEEPAADEPRTFAVALRFADGGTDDTDTPRTPVSLVRIAPDGDRRVVPLHDEVGACYYVEAPGALIAGTCWWAGAGARYEVRREGDAVVAYRAGSDEETGVGELEEVGRVEIAEDAELEVLAPGRRSDASAESP